MVKDQKCKEKYRSKLYKRQYRWFDVFFLKWPTTKLQYFQKETSTICIELELVFTELCISSDCINTSLLEASKTGTFKEINDLYYINVDLYSYIETRTNKRQDVNDALSHGTQFKIQYNTQVSCHSGVLIFSFEYVSCHSGVLIFSFGYLSCHSGNNIFLLVLSYYI